MTTIFACGNDLKIEKELQHYFSHKPSVILCQNEILVTGTEYLVHINSILPLRTNLNKGILLFYSEPPRNTQLNLSNRLLGLCETSNKTALQLLMNNGNPVITYGLAPTDTVTASSFSETTTQIALQREISTLSGQKLEPFEFSLYNENYSLSTRLLIGALQITLGE